MSTRWIFFCRCWTRSSKELCGHQPRRANREWGLDIRGLMVSLRASTIRALA